MVLINKAWLTASILFLLSSCQADFVPELTSCTAPSTVHVKESITPPSDQQLFDVFFAKGRRVYQCNPEKTRFQHWYNVQTHALLYPTKDREGPFDIDGQEIGQIFSAPLNQTLQMASPIETYTTSYYYPDGSWYASGHPLKTTSREAGRKERGDEGVNLDDHITHSVWTSTDGYFSHVDYSVRLQSLNGAPPAFEECTTKGMIVSKPFTAYFMLYANAQGIEAMQKEQDDWLASVAKYSISSSAPSFPSS